MRQRYINKSKDTESWLDQIQPSPGNIHTTERNSKRSKLILYAAVMLSLVAELVHLWVLPGRYEDWWGYGIFFLIVAMAQGTSGMALLFWPRLWIVRLSMLSNLAVVAIYVFTHTVGIPIGLTFVPQEVGALDLTVTIAELVLIMLLMMLWWDTSRERRRRSDTDH